MLDELARSLCSVADWLESSIPALWIAVLVLL